MWLIFNQLLVSTVRSVQVFVGGEISSRSSYRQTYVVLVQSVVRTRTSIRSISRTGDRYCTVELYEHVVKISMNQSEKWCKWWKIKMKNGGVLWVSRGGDIIISSCSMDGYMEYNTTLAMHLVRTLVIDPSACVQQTKLEATISWTPLVATKKVRSNHFVGPSRWVICVPLSLWV